VSTQLRIALDAAYDHLRSFAAEPDSAASGA
jgi:hypothetical protein